MRAYVPERSGLSSWLIVTGALLIAIGALALRPQSDGATFAPWAENAAVAPLPAPAAPAAPAPPATPLPRINARVGIQVGHWQSAEMPDELATLRTQTGANSGGAAEVDLNLAIARQVVALLAARGISADLLPATIPPGYAADAFVALHCDANNDPAMMGFKLARFRDSAIPDRDDALLAAITATYGAATGQPLEPTITRAMTGYYAFNSEDFAHAIAPRTPGVIIELGFVTSPLDRALLTGRQAAVAQGVADGIVRFLLGQ